MSDTWIDALDFFICPFYIIAVYMYALNIVRRNRSKKPYYRFLLPALMCKIIGGISLCLIYTYYYTYGGDATNYFISANTFSNVLLSGDFSLFVELMSYKKQNVYDVLAYTDKYGYFMFSPHDYYALFTVWLTVPFVLLGCKSILASTVLLASLSFVGLWKLYEVFISEFPALTKQMAIAIFFVPSVFFWGSGILKDTYTLSGIGFFIYGMYRFQIQKKRRIKYVLMIVGATVIFLNIKPYVFFALMPGSLIWIFFYRINRIKNQLLRILAIPLLLTSLVGLILSLLQYFGQYLGEYNLDQILLKAVKTQRDLIRDVQYGGNNYDIGAFEPTIGGVVSKIPAALNMAFFRPYLWAVRNPVMLLTALENSVLLFMSVFILFRVKTTVLIGSLFSHPLLVFSFLFSVFFAFSVGLTTANYGALARLKIPYIPFFVASLFILYYLNNVSFRRR